MYLCKGSLIFKFLKILFTYGCAGLPCCMGFSLVSASGGLCRYSVWTSRWGGFSCCRAQALGHMGPVLAAPRLQSTGLVVVPQGLSCPEAWGIFLAQGLNLCLLHWQSDSLLLSHEGSSFIFKFLT